MQASALRDDKGLPPNIKPPRNGWEFWRECGHDRRFGVRVFRQRYKDIERAFGYAFIHRWWSWQVGVCLFGTWYSVARWRARWAV